MDTRLDSLSLEFKSLAIELLARLAEARIPVFIINTRRTDEEQAESLAKGVSWVQHSKHQDGNALDVCPLDVYNVDGPKKLNWNPNHPVWHKIGVIGESLGLTWGGSWQKRDLGHFELKTPSSKEVVA